MCGLLRLAEPWPTITTTGEKPWVRPIAVRKADTRSACSVMV